jgi:hypothetical protein
MDLLIQQDLQGLQYYLAVKEIAREIAADIIDANTQLTPQHLKGDYNDVLDTLSFAGTVRGKTIRQTTY